MMVMIIIQFNSFLYYVCPVNNCKAIYTSKNVDVINYITDTQNHNDIRHKAS